MRTVYKLGMAGIAAAVLIQTNVASAQQGFGRGAQRATPATPATEQALLEALAGPDGEYAAYAEYAAIIEKHGQVQPYANIIGAEERHITALKRHFEMRGLAIPENPYIGKIQAPANLIDAARAGIEAEKRNLAMFDRLLEQVEDQPDIVRVFTHLRAASSDCHLPMFEAAAANGGTMDTLACQGGNGQRRGGPPSWAGAQGRRGCGLACGQSSNTSGQDASAPAGRGRGMRHGFGGGKWGQGQQ